MYGLIHRAARQMVIQDLGEARWSAIAAQSDIRDDDLISAKVYSDDATMRLLEAIRETFGWPMEELLERFGVYWIEFAATTPYSAMMDLAGSDLLTCLRNLDRLHSGIQLSMPDAMLPEFTVLETGRDYINVRYTSRRVGLEPFVKGLLMGLLKRFDLKGGVTAIGPSDRGVLFHIALEG